MDSASVEGAVAEFTRRVERLPGVLGVVPDRREGKTTAYTLLNSQGQSAEESVQAAEQATSRAYPELGLEFISHNLAGSPLSAGEIEDAIEVLRGHLAFDRGEFVTRAQFEAYLHGR
jgi:hypothetical protein